MVDVFNDYVKFCYEMFGDCVKWWIIINELWEFVFFGYGFGLIFLGKKDFYI